MNRPEIIKQFDQTEKKKSDALLKIYDAVKPLVPALRDLSQHHQADRLEATLAEYEQAVREQTAFMDNNGKEMIQVILAGLRGGAV